MFDLNIQNQEIILTFLIVYCNANNGQYARRSGFSFTGSGYGGGSFAGSARKGSDNIIIPVGVSRYHPVEYRNIELPAAAKAKPRTFELMGGHIPLNIIFNERSSNVRVVDRDEMQFGYAMNLQHSKSIVEPQVTYHEVNVPIFEEVHQVIECVFSEIQQYGDGSYDSGRVSSVGKMAFDSIAMC